MSEISYSVPEAVQARVEALVERADPIIGNLPDGSAAIIIETTGVVFGTPESVANTLDNMKLPEQANMVREHTPPGVYLVTVLADGDVVTSMTVSVPAGGVGQA